jgi:hypothetical protein
MTSLSDSIRECDSLVGSILRTSNLLSQDSLSECTVLVPTALQNTLEIRAQRLRGWSLIPGGQRPSKAAYAGKRSSHPYRRLEEQNKKV